VNTDIPLDSLVKSCKYYLEHQDEADYPIHNVSMLFYGAPGCGKTEFAKHLAQALGKKLILKKASDLIDKYIGESEKNIAAAFREAEETGDILFIDEADSLLQDRSGAQRSWEITQVNELLVQMEQFKGIVLFSTNFEKSLDKASLRRFHFKVRFDAIQEQHIEGVFEEYFKRSLGSGVISVPRVNVKDLRGVTFGDFKVVSYRLALGQIEANVEDIFKALLLEKSSRGEKKALGF
jgi:transitional endoplasmic reticulum ATPase